MSAKKAYIRTFIIAFLFTCAVLISLPKIPIVIDTKLLNLDTFIGGYAFSFLEGKITADFRTFYYGMDFAPATRLVLAPKEEISSEDLNLLSERLMARIEGIGYLDYDLRIVESESPKIEVCLPTTKELTYEKPFLTQKGLLYFRQLKSDAEWDEENYQQFYLNSSFWEDTPLTDSMISSAVAKDQNVRLILTPEGHEKFGEIIESNVDRPIGIFMDDSSFPLAMPVVSLKLAEAVEAGQQINPVIEGGLTSENARLLALQVNTGELPVSLELETTETVPPKIESSLLLEIGKYFGIGFAVMTILIIIFFREPGLLGWVSFFFFGVFSGALVKIFNVLLTLESVGVLVTVWFMFFGLVIATLVRLRKNLKKGKPWNLAVAQSVLLKGFWAGAGLFGLILASSVAYFINLQGLSSAYLMSLLAFVAVPITYNFVFKTLLRTLR